MMIKRHILLSGGIGSGKSAVARILRDRGFDVIEADNVGHKVLEPTGEAFADIANEWPSVLVDGEIDRSRLASIVFSDEVALLRLESISHPAIRHRVSQLVTESSSSTVFVEMPLLPDFLPGSWIRVVVDARDELRRQRLLVRGMEERDIELRMRAQPSRQEWLDAADVVIANDHDLEALQANVDEFLAQITD